MPRPVTTRIGGSGGSPWLVALAAVAVLGAVVWVGMSGRTSGPAAGPPTAIVRPPTVPSVPPVASSAAATPAPEPTTRPAPSVELEWVAATVVVDGRSYTTLFDGLDSPVRVGTLLVPLPSSDSKGSLDLARFGPGQPNFESFGTWPLPLDRPFRRQGTMRTLLSVNVPGSPRLVNAPDTERLGYSVTVNATREPAALLLRIELRLGEGRRPG